MILAGDIGGTNTRLAVFEVTGGGLETAARHDFPSRHHESPYEIVGTFLATHRLQVKQACFGVAGPVKDGRCVATNLPWVVDAHELAKILALQTVHLLNDLEASAYGVAAVEQGDFALLNEGETQVEGNAAIIAAGTGLGEAGYYWDGMQHHPFACEGGHVDFAPRNELEMELHHFLLARFEHVSYERVVSGPGLLNIFEFLRDNGHGEEPEWLAEEMRQQDPSAVVSRAALDGRSELCARALELFVSLYGAEAGNLALKVMATGGLFVGGGIAPKIISKLTDGTFMQAFADKGRMRPYLEAIPVRVILNDKTALLGAAHYAELRATNKPFALVAGRSGS
jgi:glucokinase